MSLNFLNTCAGYTMRSFQKIFFFFFVFFVQTYSFFLLASYDLTVVSNINQADGLGKIAIGVMDFLKDDIKINCIATSLKPNDLSDNVKAILSNKDKTPGKVSILFDPVWRFHKKKDYIAPYEKMPDSTIKIAYSMLESTEIPPQWVKIFNRHFDAIAVPDPFLIDVYKRCGVNIPIFELPLGMHLDPYLDKPQRVRPSTPFIFGTTVSCDDRKNYPLLIEAFAEEFGNAADVVLKLHCRFGSKIKECEELIVALGLKNIIFKHELLKNQEYIDFLNTFDCFVNLSKGEGFSLCPREALSLGIPCILTCNSAQITLCNSGLVKVIPSEILEPAMYNGLFGKQVGHFYTCTKEDVKAAMREVYQNYSCYLQKAQEGPQWVSQYHWKNLKQKYLSLIKPKRIILGEKNILTDEYLMTDSQKLYDTYQRVFK